MRENRAETVIKAGETVAKGGGWLGGRRIQCLTASFPAGQRVLSTASANVWKKDSGLLTTFCGESTKSDFCKIR